jgi:hypothetical protein
MSGRNLILTRADFKIEYDFSDTFCQKKGMHECKVCMGWISPHTLRFHALLFQNYPHCHAP